MQVGSLHSLTFIYPYIYSAIFERLAKDGRQFEDQTKEHIHKYAEAGLRTLVVAYRELGLEEYKEWEQKFLKAKASLTEGRDVLMDELADKIESELVLLGVTAVEDKLQKGVSMKFYIFLQHVPHIFFLVGLFELFF